MTDDILLTALMVMFVSLFFVERTIDRRGWKQEMDRLHTHYQDEIDKLHVYHREQYEKYQDERDNLMDRLQAESFREYKTQQIKMVKATKDVPEDRPIFDELL